MSFRPRDVRYLPALLAGFLLLSFHARSAAAQPTVYLDLGEVVVTEVPDRGLEYVEGIRDWIRSIQARGYEVALMTNIPASFGDTCLEKYRTLQDYVANRFLEPEAFNWGMFDTIIMPPFDRYRKPHPYQFVSGLAHACPDPAYFIGESESEVRMAEEWGYAASQVPAGGGGRPLPDEITDGFDENFDFPYPAQCDFDTYYQNILDPKDRDDPPQPCVLSTTR